MIAITETYNVYDSISRTFVTNQSKFDIIPCEDEPDIPNMTKTHYFWSGDELVVIPYGGSVTIEYVDLMTWRY